jgi:hypothetical protein
MQNQTEEAFDEVSHEWQALVTHNAFDINILTTLKMFKLLILEQLTIL